MSMYNMMRTTHPYAGLFVQMLGITRELFPSLPRFRDAMLFDDDIRILTRSGGPNREGLEEGNEYMKTLPGYIKDWDDPFDPTYAWWSYKWPKDQRESLLIAMETIREVRPDLLFEDMEAITNYAVETMTTKGTA